MQSISGLLTKVGRVVMHKEVFKFKCHTLMVELQLELVLELKERLNRTFTSAQTLLLSLKALPI